MFDNFIYRPDLNGDSTPLTIEFSQPVTIENIPAVVVTANSIEIDYFVDSPRQKIVIAYPTRETRKPRQIILWQGDEYDAIGQWTETDAINRIREIFETS